MRSLVAGFGLISVLAALVYVGYLTASSITGSFGAVSSKDASSADSVVLRVSGTPGAKFSGNYATPQGNENLSGTVGANPAEYDLGGGGAVGPNVVTANVSKQQGSKGELKAEILKNGQVVQSRETNPASQTLSLTYSP